MPITEEHVSEAFDHLKTIASLHFQKEFSDQFEAIKNYGQYLGLTEEAFDELTAQTDSFVSVQRARGWVIIGFLIGLQTAVGSSES